MDLNMSRNHPISKHTQELRFEGNSEGSFAWKGGLFYLDAELDGTGNREFPIEAMGVREQVTQYTIDEETWDYLPHLSIHTAEKTFWRTSLGPD